MVYLYLDKNVVKLIYLKKSLLGQQETSFFEKKYETDFINRGAVINVDLLASAIKEALTNSGERSIADNQIFLILPQEAFYYLRTQVPADIAPSAMNAFINDKARSSFPVPLEDCLTFSFIKENGGEKVINFFGINKEVLQNYNQALSLLDLKMQFVIPESVAYFKLFEKTLRQEKKENILYLTLTAEEASGYLYDSNGLLEQKKVTLSLLKDAKLEEVVKKYVDELKAKGVKLNRLILSGDPSDKVRQDTFTKDVGVWTNPLKRIVPTFYDEYIKMLVVEGKRPFPILTFDVSFGAFIFASENKDQTAIKNTLKTKPQRSMSMPKIGMPRKEIFIFIVSFVLSFGLFVLMSKVKLPVFKSNLLATKEPTPTSSPSATPTPTPAVKRSDLKVKILNGGGVAGKASDVKDILKNKGYQDIITANADNFNYTVTEIQVKKSLSSAIPMIESDLKDYVSQPKSSASLADSSTADVVIIVGSDFK